MKPSEEILWIRNRLSPGSQSTGEEALARVDALMVWLDQRQDRIEALTSGGGQSGIEVMRALGRSAELATYAQVAEFMQVTRFEEEKPPTPKASAYEPEPEEE